MRRPDEPDDDLPAWREWVGLAEGVGFIEICGYIELAGVRERARAQLY